MCVSVHVTASMSRDDAAADADYVEALEHETRLLQKRVVECRSRLMVATVFDVTSVT